VEGNTNDDEMLEIVFEVFPSVIVTSMLFQQTSVNTSGKAGEQILHLPLGDDSSPSGDNAVGR
jgi:hypothetical protein